jgi:hypothetical protein
MEEKKQKQIEKNVYLKIVMPTGGVQIQTPTRRRCVTDVEWAHVPTQSLSCLVASHNRP